jgi:hypothetical protein
MNLILKIKAFFTNDLVARVVKTVVEVVAAQTALYTTVVPNPPNTNTSVGIAAGSGVLALLWNLGLSWATKTKSKRLDQLAAAIDAVVDKRLQEQAMANAAAQKPAPTS